MNGTSFNTEIAKDLTIAENFKTRAHSGETLLMMLLNILFCNRIVKSVQFIAE